jgi:hypothetical protein
VSSTSTAAHHDAVTFTVSSRWLGILCAWGIVVVSGCYAGVLAAGLLSLPSPTDQIGDPYFTALELLILCLVPLLVGLTVAVHAWASAQRKSLSLLAVAFTIVQAVLTSSVHFVILAVGRQPAFLASTQMPLTVLFFNVLSCSLSIRVSSFVLSRKAAQFHAAARLLVSSA